MLLVNEKIKFSAKKESPNPKEVTYWIDLTEDPEGRCWKYFDSDSKRWKIFLLGVQEGTLDAYSKDESDEKFATNEALEDLADQLDGKQDELISEVNIKTINGQSILGSGDLFFDRGLNANQVGDIVEEYCKDFITIDETHEYVQDEIDKVFNRVILDRDKCPKALLDVVDNTTFDFNALKEALIAKENHLMYIDPYNGLYRFYYYDYNDTVQYTRTTVYEGLLLEDRVIINKDGVQDSYQTSKNIEFYDGGNLGGGIKISITTTDDKDQTKADSITLLTQRQGMNYLADDGTYKRLGSVNLYTSMEGLPQQLAVLMDDNLVEINRFNEAKQYLQELNDNVYLILTDIYNEADGSRTIESNQLYTFLYDSVSDSIYIIGSINPLNQLYDGNNPLSSTKEVTQITNTAKIIRKTINSGIYANVNGFIVRVEDNQFDSVDNPLGTATTRSINFLTEGNGKDVLFNDGTYKNLQDSIDFSNFLGKDNTVPYTPTQPYHPATKKYVDDVAATKADLSDVGNVADLTTDNKTVVGAINEHETQINQHTYYINNINLTIQDIQEEIEGIHGDISDINTEISGIHSDISNINTEIDGIQQDIVTINGNIVNINNTLTQHQNTLNSHQTTLNQHQTSINNLNSSVSTINSNITDIRGDITDINNSITDLTEWVQDFEIPVATASVLGGVKIGSGVNVTADGTISVSSVDMDWSNIRNKPLFYGEGGGSSTVFGKAQGIGLRKDSSTQYTAVNSGMDLWFDYTISLGNVPYIIRPGDYIFTNADDLINGTAAKVVSVSGNVITTDKDAGNGVQTNIYYWHPNANNVSGAIINNSSNASSGVSIGLGVGISTSRNSTIFGMHAISSQFNNYGLGAYMNFTKQFQWAVGIQPYLDNSIVGAIGRYCGAESITTRSNALAISAGTEHKLYLYGVGGYTGGAITDDMKSIDEMFGNINTYGNNYIVITNNVYNSTDAVVPVPDDNIYKINYSTENSTAVAVIFTVGCSRNWIDTANDESTLVSRIAYAAPPVTLTTYVRKPYWGSGSGVLTTPAISASVPFFKLDDDSHTSTEIENSKRCLKMNFTVYESDDKSQLYIEVDEQCAEIARQYSIGIQSCMIFEAVKLENSFTGFYELSPR